MAYTWDEEVMGHITKGGVDPLEAEQRAAIIAAATFLDGVAGEQPIFTGSDNAIPKNQPALDMEAAVQAALPTPTSVALRQMTTCAIRAGQFVKNGGGDPDGWAAFSQMMADRPAPGAPRAAPPPAPPVP